MMELTLADRNRLKYTLTETADQAVECIREYSRICERLDESIKKLSDIKASTRLYPSNLDIIRDFMDEQLRYDRLLASQSNVYDELQTAVASFAGHTALAIECCMEEMDVALKIRFKTSVNKIADKLADCGIRIDFPSATGILAPYLIKTKAAENPSLFATFRVGIRKLCNI